MKKILALLSAALLALSLAACGTTKPESAADDPTVKEAVSELLESNEGAEAAEDATISGNDFAAVQYTDKEENRGYTVFVGLAGDRLATVTLKGIDPADENAVAVLKSISFRPLSAETTAKPAHSTTAAAKPETTTEQESMTTTAAKPESTTAKEAKTTTTAAKPESTTAKEAKTTTTAAKPESTTAKGSPTATAENKTDKTTSVPKTTESTTLSPEQLATEPENGRIAEKGAFFVFVPEGWCKMEYTGDEMRIRLFDTPSAVNIKDDTPEIEIRVQ